MTRNVGPVEGGSGRWARHERLLRIVHGKTRPARSGPAGVHRERRARTGSREGLAAIKDYSQKPNASSIADLGKCRTPDRPRLCLRPPRVGTTKARKCMGRAQDAFEVPAGRDSGCRGRSSRGLERLLLQPQAARRAREPRTPSDQFLRRVGDPTHWPTSDPAVVRTPEPRRSTCRKRGR
jgi:hypothetical protein